MNQLCVIFDLDGTLIDSEPLYEQADRIFLERYNIPWQVIDWNEMIGIGGMEFIQLLKEQHGLKGDRWDLREEKDKIYLEVARSTLRVFPKTVDLAKRLHANGAPMAVASGSSVRVLAETIAFTGLSRYFPVLVSADEVPKGKPAPDVFLETAKRLAVLPSACVVIEDSQYGVEAAHRAGMRCVAIPTNPGRQLPPRFRTAELLFSGGMDEFSAARAYEWIESNSTQAPNGQRKPATFEGTFPPPRTKSENSRN